MSENIEKVLLRGEKLDLLVDKTDNLMFEVRWGGVGWGGPKSVLVQCCLESATQATQHGQPATAALPLHNQADRFVKSGRALRRKMWWNNCKMKLVMSGVVVMVMFIIVLLICFSAGGARARQEVGARPGKRRKRMCYVQAATLSSKQTCLPIEAAALICRQPQSCPIIAAYHPAQAPAACARRRPQPPAPAQCCPCRRHLCRPPPLLRRRRRRRRRWPRLRHRPRPRLTRGPGAMRPGAMRRHRRAAQGAACCGMWHKWRYSLRPPETRAGAAPPAAHWLAS
jgi:hypothetical protein